MLRKHSEIIQSNLSTLVENTDLARIIPHLQSKHVLSQETIIRILEFKIGCNEPSRFFLTAEQYYPPGQYFRVPESLMEVIETVHDHSGTLTSNESLNPAHDVRLQTTNLYTALLKRGPQTFAMLRDALQESNHTDLANLLTHMDSQDSFHVNRIPSLNSLGSLESLNSRDSEDRVNFSREMGNVSPELPMSRNESNTQPFTSNSPNNLNNHTFSVPSSQDSRLPDNDLRHPSTPEPKTKSSVEPCNLSDYYSNIAPFLCGPNLSPDDLVNIRIEEQALVRVESATEWKDVGPFHYKMDSYPRGCALIVNNVEFEDKKNFPTRNGAMNDQRRMIEMLEQLYFTVEFHENQTRMQMMELVRKFSKKEELLNVDCAVIVFMSHGAEGSSEEDTEIIGVDGFGFKTKEIVSHFSNDACKALIHKPKVFIFQACRGILRDEGVLWQKQSRRMSNRTETDGRKIESSSYSVRIRTISDVFIAYAVPPGRPANRDVFNGTWFIQTIVDVFSRNAWQYDLEDMLKMVDNKIKHIDNMEVRNFQAVTTYTIGWNKKLFFNPGLRKTKELESIPVDNGAQGTDVVDNCLENRLGEESREEDGADDCSRRVCLPLSKCILI